MKKLFLLAMLFSFNGIVFGELFVCSTNAASCDLKCKTKFGSQAKSSAASSIFTCDESGYAHCKDDNCIICTCNIS